MKRRLSRSILAVAAILVPCSVLAQTRIFAGSWGLGGTNRGRVYRYETNRTWTEMSPPAGLGDAAWDLEWLDGALFVSTHEGPAAIEPPPPGGPTSPTDRPHGNKGRAWRNDGSGWVDISPAGGFGSAATSLAVIDGILYATVDQDGLYRWEGAASWTLLDSFLLAGQSIVSDMHDGRPRLFMGQDNIDELWSFDPAGLSPCPIPGSGGEDCTDGIDNDGDTLFDCFDPDCGHDPTACGCDIPPAGAVCHAGCYRGSCIHAFAVHDDGGGPLVYAGAFNGNMYRWTPSSYLFDPIDDVPLSIGEHVQGLASYDDLLHVGMSDGVLYTTDDGSAPSYAVLRGFGANLPISDMLTVPEQDLLWIGFGGVPYRWARDDGTSMIKTWDGATFVDRSTPGAFGQGVLCMLAVTPEVICDAGPAQAFECTGAQIEIQLDGTGSQVPGDILGFTPTHSWIGDFLEGIASGPTPVVHVEGVRDHVITLTVTAGTVSASCDVIVSVVDTRPPTFGGTVRCLWPPNHHYRCFSVADLLDGGGTTAADGCDGDVDVVIAAARSSQPEDELGHGDGATLDDILFDSGSVCVRQERQGVDGRGRDYVVVLSATDAAGNVTLREAILHVPHDQRPSRRCDFHPVDTGLNPNDPPALEPGYSEGTYPPATRPPRIRR